MAVFIPHTVHSTKRIGIVSSSTIFTQPEFAVYVKDLLVTHSIEFVDEENEWAVFTMGSDGDKLAALACGIDNSKITLANGSGVLGVITLVNEYDYDRNLQTVETREYSAGVKHLAPNKHGD